MPFYDVEVCEVWVQSYRVEADNPAKAILAVGDVDSMPDPDYLEDALDYGAPLRDIADSVGMTPEELASQLKEANIATHGCADDPGEDFIPAIHDVRLSEEQ